jgi:WD40 repeat protein
LTWPPKDFTAYAARCAASAEGWWQWEGHGEFWRSQPLSVVWTAWWTDALGRKHHRIHGNTAESPEHPPLFTPRTAGRPPLALIYPDSAVVRTTPKGSAAIGQCSCGLIGLPPDLAWMGPCCGPCHDRRLERGTAPSEPEGSGCVDADFTADRRKVAVLGGDNRRIRLWDVAAGREDCALSGHHPFGMVALSPRADFVAAVGWLPAAEEVTLWDLGRAGERVRFRPHARIVLDLKFAPDGRTLATVGVDEGATLWDVPTLRPRYRLPGYFGNRRGIAFRPDGQVLATASESNQVSLWDMATGQFRSRIFTHCPAPAVAFSPDGRTLAVWAGGETTQTDIVLWDADCRPGQLARRVLSEHKHPVTDVVFHPGGRLVAALSTDEPGIRLWDADTGQEQCHLEWPSRKHGPGGIAFAADGSGLLVVRHPAVPPDFWPLALLTDGTDKKAGAAAVAAVKKR